MDKATVNRLRLYALIYRLEDAIKAGVAFEQFLALMRSTGQMMRQYQGAVNFLPAAYLEEVQRIEERQYTKRRQMLSEAAAILGSGLSVCLLSYDEIAGKMLEEDLRQLSPPNVGNYGWPPVVPERYIPQERGFTGYCNNRSKYGPRKPKRR